eukprot:m.3847 g.3847  ORF g.3847 m.3847 type:complete len:99 (+) comp9862_c0_seq1:43-339(+)
MQQRFSATSSFSGGQGPLSMTIQQQGPAVPVSTVQGPAVPGLQQAPQNPQQQQQQQTVDRDKIYGWIQDLTNPDARENSLLELKYCITPESFGRCRYE